jgi:hypothetical protein
VNILSLLWSCYFACSDRPNWLVGNDNLGPVADVLLDELQLSWGIFWKANLDKLHLVEDNFFSFTGFSLFELLANAWNNTEPSFESFLDLLSDELIGLAKNVSSLRVAEDYPVDAKISKNLDKGKISCDSSYFKKSGEVSPVKAPLDSL